MRTRRFRVLLALIIFSFVVVTTNTTRATTRNARLPLAENYTQTVLHNFDGGDGAFSYGGLIMDATNNLYGTASAGGAYGAGTAFKLTPPARGNRFSPSIWTRTVLHSFGATTTDGRGPVAGLIADSKGALYGTTPGGGSSSACSFGCGTIFRITLDSMNRWTETVLYSFSGNADGADPYGPLVTDARGNLYGTTQAGGANGFGTVFELSAPTGGQRAWSKSVLYSFAGGLDGARPDGKLVAGANGALYGTTVAGGGGPNCPAGCGTVYRLNPPAPGTGAWTEAVLYAFSGGANGDGLDVQGTLLPAADGSLYGTTSAGGIGRCGMGCGTVFALVPPANGRTPWTQTVIHSFSGPPDGQFPLGGLISDNAGSLYGTAGIGGPGGSGTVFRLIAPRPGRPAWSFQIIYAFIRALRGSELRGDLIADSSGAIYGTTYLGGTFGNGVIYEIVTSPQSPRAGGGLVH